MLLTRIIFIFLLIQNYFIRVLELEAALLDTESPSASDIYAICKGQTVPANLRPDVWQACLYVTDRDDELSHFNEVFDLPEQNIIREDCQQLVGMFIYLEHISIRLNENFLLLFILFNRIVLKRYKQIQINSYTEMLQRNSGMRMKIKSPLFLILNLY